MKTACDVQAYSRICLQHYFTKHTSTKTNIGKIIPPFQPESVWSRKARYGYEAGCNATSL